MSNRNTLRCQQLLLLTAVAAAWYREELAAIVFTVLALVLAQRAKDAQVAFTRGPPRVVLSEKLIRGLRRR